MRQPKGDRSRPVQRRALMLGSAASIMLPTWRARAQTASVLNIATSGDPGPLDPTPVTSDLLSEITQLFYETLYIFGPDYSHRPAARGVPARDQRRRKTLRHQAAQRRAVSRRQHDERR